MGAFESIVREAEHEAQVARKWAVWNQRLYYILGTSAFIAGSIAGISATADWLRPVTAFGAFAAALFAGLQTVFDPKSKADSNWDKLRDFRSLLREAEIISEKQGGPTEADLRKFNEDLTTISKRAAPKST